MVIKTEQLRYSYSNQERLSFADLNIHAGQHTLLLGESGCGKTTLLHLLAGLRRPDSGKVFIADTDITTLSSSRLDKFRGANIGLVFQSPHFIRSISIFDNLAITASLAGKKPDKNQMKEMLAQLGLSGKENKPAFRLSTGEQQRAAIARALVVHPKIILADEPTSALDDKNTEGVIELLKEQASANDATLIIVTHDQRLKSHFKNKVEL